MADAHPASMADDERRLLLRATVAAGGIAGVAAAVPFVRSMAPSERALAEGAPVTIDLARVPPGGLVSVAWRGKPVWVLHRTPAMIDMLRQRTDMLTDPSSRRSEQPAYTQNDLRSIKPQFSVLVGLCTHLGCVPLFRPETSPADLGPAWTGGYYCPCHGSKFDLAGRVFKNVPAPVNLVVPPHHYLTETTLVVGSDKPAT